MALDRTWYNSLTDDDGSNLVGTLWNKAAVDSLMDAVDAEVLLYPKLPASTAPTTTGTQTAPATPSGTGAPVLHATNATAPTPPVPQPALAIPSGTGDLVLYLNNATLLTIQGIAAGVANQTLTLVSKGAAQVALAHLHASRTAPAKLKLFATSGLTSLAAGSGVAVFEYDATVTQWRLLAHDQGAWITPAYAGTDYTAATGTWTVDSGDAIELRHWPQGRPLAVKGGGAAA